MIRQRWHYALSNGRGGRIYGRTIGKHTSEAACRLAKLQADRENAKGGNDKWMVHRVDADPIPRDV